MEENMVREENSSLSRWHLVPRNILVTGGAGFIGSHFVRLLLRRPEATVVNLDALRYSGNLVAETGANKV